MVPRRVVTGHAADGASIVLSDGPAPVSKEIAAAGVVWHEIWSTSNSPASITAAVIDDPAEAELTVPPPRGGTKIRINEFQPGHLDPVGLQSPRHRTSTIDYGIVLEGELVLAVDDSELTLRAGDVVVQRGTNHAWANRGDHVARIAFVMVDGSFEDALQDMAVGDEAGAAGPRFDD